MTFLWATRGRDWGFRFLRDGGFEDPLPHYEAAFSQMDSELEALRRTGEGVALRFPDPGSRTDSAGRVISHDFVVYGSKALDITSVEDGLQKIWTTVAEEYARIWDASEPLNE